MRVTDIISLKVRVALATVLVFSLLCLGIVFRINPELVLGKKEVIKWQSSLEQTSEPAKRDHKYVLVDVYTDWCHWCKQLDNDVFTKQELVHYLNQDFICVKVKADDGGEGTVVASGFAVQSFPKALVFAPEGTLIGQISGYKEAPEYMAALKELVSKHQQKQENKANPDEQAEPAHEPEVVPNPTPGGSADWSDTSEPSGSQAATSGQSSSQAATSAQNGDTFVPSAKNGKQSDEQSSGQTAPSTSTNW